MSKELVPSDSPDSGKSQFLVYEAEDGRIKIDVRLEDETVWLTQQLMADLFQTSQQNISLHIQNIHEEGELAPEATHKKYLSVPPPARPPAPAEPTPHRFYERERYNVTGLHFHKDLWGLASETHS